MAEHVVEKGRPNAQKAARLVAEYRHVLRLATIGPVPVVPSPLLDQVWHLHLTDTRAYAALCEAEFGRFVRDTPPPRIWPSPTILRTMGWNGAPVIFGFWIMGLGGWLAAVGVIDAAFPASKVAPWT